LLPLGTEGNTLEATGRTRGASKVMRKTLLIFVNLGGVARRGPYELSVLPRFLAKDTGAAIVQSRDYHPRGNRCLQGERGGVSAKWR